MSIGLIFAILLTISGFANTDAATKTSPSLSAHISIVKPTALKTEGTRLLYYIRNDSDQPVYVPISFPPIDVPPPRFVIEIVPRIENRTYAAGSGPLPDSYLNVEEYVRKNYRALPPGAIYGWEKTILQDAPLGRYRISGTFIAEQFSSDQLQHLASKGITVPQGILPTEGLNVVVISSPRAPHKQ